MSETVGEDETREESVDCPYSDYGDCAAVLKFQNQEPSSRHQVPSVQFEVYSRREIRVGRDDKCDIVILDGRVSKQHFRIYSIIYDESEAASAPPLLYCEDFQSTNGTFINDVMIGNIHTEKVAHLLSDGDVIQIRPYWNFQFCQPSQVSSSHRMALTRDFQYFKNLYSISERVLGRGYYGVVYLAQEIETKRQVACKIVDLKAAAQQLFRHQSSSLWTGADNAQLEKSTRHKVLREIKILAQLSHPHIVDLRKAFCSDTTLYIITSLAAGGDLFSYLEAHGGYLDDWNGRVISRQIVFALEYLHSRGIGHRDIKPENVLVTQTDFGSRVVLTDFGFANHVDANTGRMMSLVGTEGCAAPEIWADRGHTLAADMWSFGVLIVRILTGLPMNPNIEPNRLGDTEIIDYFLVSCDMSAREKWLEIPPRALHLVKNLLNIMPGRRILACEAIHHQWYTMPPTEAAALDEGYQRVIASWKPREATTEVIEVLPGSNALSPATLSRTVTRVRRTKLPNASLSPYLGLERHLTQKLVQTRQDILANLNESGSPFMTDNSIQRMRTSAKSTAQRSRHFEVMAVEATDIFGMSQALDVTQQHPKTQEESNAISIASWERAYGFDLDDTTEDSQPSNEACNPALSNFESSEVEDLPEASGAEENFSSVSDRRIHHVVASQLPRFATAKVMKEAITRMKESAASEIFG